MDRVLITGSSGLLGTWTLNHWDSSLEPVLVRHSDHDLRDPEEFRAVISRVSPAAVLHLAWCASGMTDYRHSDDNARWTESSYAAAELCVERGIRFFATGTVIDDSPGGDAYSQSKFDLHQLLAGRIDSGLVCWIRPFYVFDPERGRPALVADARQAASESVPVKLRSPESRHDFIHASDAGAALALVVSKGLGGVVEVGTGTLRTVADLARACGASVGVPDLSSPPISTRAADTSSLTAHGWNASTTDVFFGTKLPDP